MGVIKIMSWNVNGTGNQIKRKCLELKMKRESPDIIFLQETHQKSEDSNKMYIKGIQLYEKAFGTSKSRGVATLISSRVQFEKLKSVVDPEGRYLIIIGKIYEETVTLVNIYAPNERQKEFLMTVSKILQKESLGSLIVSGDFNLIRSKYDTTNVARQDDSVKMSILDNWMIENGVFDTWREIKGQERVYTFHSKVHDTYSRIDYIMVSRDILNRVGNVNVGIFKESDHAEVNIELNVYTEKKENYWRYDGKLYKNEEDKKRIIEIWEENWKWNDNDEVNYNVVWDTMKAIFRGESIKLSCNKYKASKKN